MVIVSDMAYFGFRFTIGKELMVRLICGGGIWTRPAGFAGVTFLVLTLSVDHKERAALVIFELSSGGVATVAVLMNKGSGRQAWSRPSTTIPLYFLPLYSLPLIGRVTLCMGVWSCWVLDFDNCSPFLVDRDLLRELWHPQLRSWCWSPAQR